MPRTVVGCLLAAVSMVVASPIGAKGMTWIVYAANGRGTSFTDIPPALAAAQNGDKIVVRSGRYLGGTIDGANGFRFSAPATVVLQ